MIKLKDLLFEQDGRFIKRANQFLMKVQSMSDKYMAKTYDNLQAPKFYFTKGSRYWKVVRQDDTGGKSVHLFLDTSNGDVLKAAGWRAPAKHARGNIYKPDFGMGGVTPYGAKYL
jgi:hypothetical protein